MVQDGQRKGDIEKNALQNKHNKHLPPPKKKKSVFLSSQPPCAKDGIMDGRKDVYARLVSRLWALPRECIPHPKHD